MSLSSLSASIDAFARSIKCFCTHVACLDGCKNGTWGSGLDKTRQGGINSCSLAPYPRIKFCGGIKLFLTVPCINNYEHAFTHRRPYIPENLQMYGHDQLAS